jgi:CheY-like chemotaxis protein
VILWTDELEDLVAHDFNNLIGVITGYTELLQRGMAEGSIEARRLAEVSAAAFRAADLTRQLLAFSRSQILEPQVIDLNAVTREMESMLKRVIGEQVQLVTVLPQGLGSVRADPGQMGQILVNLAANARDAMPCGGRLTLETANADLDEAHAGRVPDIVPGRYVMLSVSDTGTGMPPAVRARVFEPFFTTKKPGRGTGLGLATVYGIVRQSGGYIEVSSEPDHGTRFKIYLPRVDEPPQQRRSSPLSAPGGGTETVLLVEDDAALRGIVKELLEEAGYNVFAADPDEALELASAEHTRIDLLLTDVAMPGLTGPDLTRRLREVQPGLPVLFMSGHSESGVLEGDPLAPGAAFLQKPFASDVLLRKVRQVLDDRPL